ncbi:MAG: sterol desaturase family protein [Alphaproteobacteria bacterium]
MTMKQDKTWQYHPELPISGGTPLAPSPFKEFRLSKALFWLMWHGLLYSANFALLLTAIGSWIFIEATGGLPTTLTLGWIGSLFLRNIFLSFLIAGGLHFFFYILNRQHETKFNLDNGFAKNNKRFTFKHQVWDNMFWTLASGVPLWTLCEVIYFYMLANGLTLFPLLEFSDNRVWFIILILLVTPFESIHFFFTHRLLHWPPLYRMAHHLHHRNIRTGPWSGISMHPIEHVIYFSGFVIFLLIPAHPIHMLFFMQYLCLGAMVSHTDIQDLRIGKLTIPLGAFYHHLHHRYFECNYGTTPILCDAAAGTFHDGTEESMKKMRDRLRSRRQNISA